MLVEFTTDFAAKKSAPWLSSLKRRLQAWTCSLLPYFNRPRQLREEVLMAKERFVIYLRTTSSTGGAPSKMG